MFIFNVFSRFFVLFCNCYILPHSVLWEKPVGWTRVSIIERLAQVQSPSPSPKEVLGKSLSLNQVYPPPPPTHTPPPHKHLGYFPLTQDPDFLYATLAQPPQLIHEEKKQGHLTPNSRVHSKSPKTTFVIHLLHLNYELITKELCLFLFLIANLKSLLEIQISISFT